MARMSRASRSFSWPTEGSSRCLSAPVLAPDEIARVALGFEVNSAFARELQDLIGVRVTFQPGAEGPQLETTPAIRVLEGVEYLAMTTRISTAAPAVDIALLKPMDEVLAPYRQLAKNLGLVFGATLFAARQRGTLPGPQRGPPGATAVARRAARCVR